MATRRRHTPPINILGISRATTWLVAVENWGKVLESSKIEKVADLYAALVEEHLRYHRAGWSSEERMFYNGDFFVRRAGHSQRRVFITSLNPAVREHQTEGHYDRFGWMYRAPSTGYGP